MCAAAASGEGVVCGFCVTIEACWQERWSVSSRGQQKHLVREKIIGVSGVCASDRAAPPPPPAACVCRDGGESPAGGGQRSRGSTPRHPFLGAAGARTVWERRPPPPRGTKWQKPPRGGRRGPSRCPEDVPSRDEAAAAPPTAPQAALRVSKTRKERFCSPFAGGGSCPALTHRAAGRARGRAQFRLSTPPDPEVRFPGTGGRTGSGLRDARPRPAVVPRPAALPGPSSPLPSRPVPSCLAAEAGLALQPLSACEGLSYSPFARGRIPSLLRFPTAVTYSDGDSSYYYSFLSNPKLSPKVFKTSSPLIVSPLPASMRITLRASPAPNHQSDRFGSEKTPKLEWGGDRSRGLGAPLPAPHPAKAQHGVASRPCSRRRAVLAFASLRLIAPLSGERWTPHRGVPRHSGVALVPCFIGEPGPSSTQRSASFLR